MVHTSFVRTEWLASPFATVRVQSLALAPIPGRSPNTGRARRGALGRAYPRPGGRSPDRCGTRSAKTPRGVSRDAQYRLAAGGDADARRPRLVAERCKAGARGGGRSARDGWLSAGGRRQKLENDFQRRQAFPERMEAERRRIASTADAGGPCHRGGSREAGRAECGRAIAGGPQGDPDGFARAPECNAKSVS